MEYGMRIGRMPNQAIIWVSFEEEYGLVWEMTIVQVEGGEEKTLVSDTWTSLESLLDSLRWYAPSLIEDYTMEKLRVKLTKLSYID